MSLLGTLQKAYSFVSYGIDKAVEKERFYDLTDTLIDETPVTMKEYQGKVLCVVNVASN
jgi:hypothetical protein